MATMQKRAKTAPRAKTNPPKKARAKSAPPTKLAKVASGELTVVDVAHSLKLDPKIARAKLRRAGMSATEGRYPTMAKGSRAHTQILAILKGANDEE